MKKRNMLYDSENGKDCLDHSFCYDGAHAPCTGNYRCRLCGLVIPRAMCEFVTYKMVQAHLRKVARLANKYYDMLEGRKNMCGINY